jgi:hypothetical protein
VKSVAKKVKAFWVLYLYRRPEPVALGPDVQASPAFAVAEHEAVQPVAAAVVRAVPGPLAAAVLPVAVPVVNVPADPAHVASAVAVAADLHAALVGSALELIPDAFVVVAVAAEQLHVAVVAVVVVLVLRRVHLAVVAVAQVLPHVQLAPHHGRLDAARFAVVVAAAQCAAVRVVQWLRHAVVERVEPAAVQPVVVTFALLVVHRVHDAHLAPGTSVPSHDPVLYSRGGPWPDQDGIAGLRVRCSQSQSCR